MHKQGIAIILVAALAASVSSCAFDVDADGITSCIAGFSGPEVTNAEEILADFNATLYAMSFTLTQSSAPSSVRLNLKALGTPTGTLTVTLHADSGGNPSITQSGSGTLDASTILPTAAAAYYTFTFASPQTLAPGTYWVVLHGASAFAPTKGIYWMASDVAGAYSGGSSLTSANNGGVWNTSGITNKSFLFQLGCSS